MFRKEVVEKKKLLEQIGYKVFLIPLSKLVNNKRKPNDVQYNNERK